jgi:hypothetical protein
MMLKVLKDDLHERLATLFVSAMAAGYVDRPLAVWHSIRSVPGRLNRSSLPGLIRQSILLRKKMDAWVEPAHDDAGAVQIEREPL